MRNQDIVDGMRRALGDAGFYEVESDERYAYYEAPLNRHNQMRVELDTRMLVANLDAGPEAGTSIIAHEIEVGLGTSSNAELLLGDELTALKASLADDLDEACRIVQERVGQTDGGFASQFWSGDADGRYWDDQEDMLHYLLSERFNVQANEDETFDAFAERIYKDPEHFAAEQDLRARRSLQAGNFMKPFDATKVGGKTHLTKDIPETDRSVRIELGKRQITTTFVTGTQERVVYFCPLKDASAAARQDAVAKAAEMAAVCEAMSQPTVMEGLGHIRMGYLGLGRSEYEARFDRAFESAYLPNGQEDNPTVYEGYMSLIDPNRENILTMPDYEPEHEPNSRGKYETVLIFGEGATRLFSDGETRVSELQDEGSVEVVEFDTPAELNAFVKGVDAAVGWMAVTYAKASELDGIYDPEDVPDTPKPGM